MISLLLVALLGCRGRPSNKPPIHIVPNMDNQPRYEAQEAGPYFLDGSAMRQPVAGTIARGTLNNDPLFYEGLIPGTDQLTPKSPITPTTEGLERGRERFNIYCSMCHGQAGDGRGIMVKKKYIPPPTFHSDLMRNHPDGHFFNVITNGVRNMPAYGPQVPVADRWQIVNYIRALQRGQWADMEDVPEERRAELKMVMP